MVSVAIIGAGPAGLVAAKECLEKGMDITIYEKSSCIGGVWSSGLNGLTWDSLKTNISKYSCCYSDFEWQRTQSVFPNSREVHEYLLRYARRHNILKYTQFNQCVVSLEYSDESQSSLRLSMGDSSSSINFDKVIVASGFFSRARYPFADVDDVKKAFKGAVLHARDYKTAKDFLGKNVAVIGGAFGGVDVATSVAETANSVVHLFRRPSYIISRRPLLDNIPFDLMSGNREQEESSKDTSLSERYKMANAWLGSLTDQNNVHPSLFVNSDGSHPPQVAISDTYLDLIAQGKITPQRMSAVSDDKSQLTPVKDAMPHCDTVIFCTGYRHSLGFLSSHIKTVLDYRESDDFLPILAYQSTFHPDLPNVGFVGAYRGPYFSVMELQARFLSKLFVGEIDISGEDMCIKEHLDQMKDLRDSPEKPQFPYKHIGMGDDLARLCDILPSETDVPSDVYSHFRDSAVVPAHYRLYGDGACVEQAIQFIRSLPTYKNS